ncbi:Pectinesterase/pectinesterase inhibitor [Rhynchospora pubera]|uniref:Pectinesterase n=1 Tax=Rhynchospora pubera TaxID=906938 RepID=A0AAV8HN15_9POAL|nr:Pectinesterase/pectinesterase inhibitor [Rhynchospora pubera]
MGKKVVAGLSASVLVAIFCAGAIIMTLMHSTNRAGDNLPSSIHTTSKAMASKSVCSTALHRESCEATLSNLSPKRSVGDAMFEASFAQTSSSKTEIFKNFIYVTLSELEKAVKRSAEVANGNVNQRAAAAKNDCKKLLTDALQYTASAVKLLGDKDIESLAKESDNINLMVTAAMTYMYNCVDGFEDSSMKAEMDKILNNATVMGSNALGVINSISSSVVKTQSQQLTSRRLLGFDIDQHGYPSWLSAGERKLLQDNSSEKPNAVVALDGSGNYKTITDAIKSIPSGNSGRYVIYVKAGVYDEKVQVPRNAEGVTMYGDGMDKTIVTGNPSDSAGVTKLQAVFAVDGQKFIAKNMGFRNTAGPKGWPAVAVRTSAEYVTFYNCKIDGYQDTLYTHSGRQLFRDCTISGTIDFIFGNSASVFQNCKIVVNMPQHGAQNVITANGRTDPNMKTGIVLHNCEITHDKAFEANRLKTKNYLGRPWKIYSRVVIMESKIGDLIDPTGWMSWRNTNTGQDTVYYAEYSNTGPGADTTKRVQWPGFHVLTKSDVTQYTVASFINNNNWLTSTGVPSVAGLMN